MCKPLIKSCHSKFPLMVWICANALPLLVNINVKGRWESPTSCLSLYQAKHFSSINNSSRLLISQHAFSKAFNEHEQGQILRHEEWKKGKILHEGVMCSVCSQEYKSNGKWTKPQQDIQSLLLYKRHLLLLLLPVDDSILSQSGWKCMRRMQGRETCN